MKTPTISIESADIKGNDVIVIYTANDEWFDTTLSLLRLRDYAAYMGLNKAVIDSCLNGEHEQTEFTFEFEEWFDENLETVCKSWLQIYHVENPFEAITYQLGVLIEETNK